MDFQTEKELNRLKNEIKFNDIELEAEKESFAQLLIDGLGEKMVNVTKNPPKKNIFRGLILKLQRLITIQHCKRIERKLLKYNESQQLDNNFKQNFYE